jgi:ribosomal protein S16
MLMIRLQRRGKKHQPYYRLVVGEKRSKILGEQIENLGWYDPKSREKGFKKERVLYWLGVGAKVSPTAHNLLVDTEIISDKKVPAHKKSKKKIEEKTEEKKEEKVEEKPAEKPVEKPVEKPEEKPAEKPEEKPEEKPVEKTEEKKD